MFSNVVGSLLFIFVAMKLLGKLAWSWWWVASPLWIAVLLHLLPEIVMAILFAIFGEIRADISFRIYQAKKK